MPAPSRLRSVELQASEGSASPLLPLGSFTVRSRQASAEHPPKREAPPAAEAQEGSPAPALSTNIQEQQQAAIALSLQSRRVPGTLRQTLSVRDLPAAAAVSEGRALPMLPLACKRPMTNHLVSNTLEKQ